MLALKGLECHCGPPEDSGQPGDTRSLDPLGPLHPQFIVNRHKSNCWRYPVGSLIYGMEMYHGEKPSQIPKTASRFT